MPWRLDSLGAGIRDRDPGFRYLKWQLAFTWMGGDQLMACRDARGDGSARAAVELLISWKAF